MLHETIAEGPPKESLTISDGYNFSPGGEDFVLDCEAPRLANPIVFWDAHPYETSKRGIEYLTWDIPEHGQDALTESIGRIC